MNRKSITGVTMALDNVLALFLLPLFGVLSDQVDTAWGMTYGDVKPAKKASVLENFDVED